MRTCQHCGAQMQKNSQFCTNCGSAVKEELAAPAVTEVPVIPESQIPTPKESVKEEKPSKKKPSRKKVIVILCLAVLLVGLAMVAYFWLSWYFSPEQKVLRLLADGKYEEALELVEDERSLRRSDAFEESLLARLKTVKEGFTGGTMEYAAVMEELDSIEQMGVEKVTDQISDYREYVESLNVSRTNFSTAEQFFTDGSYPEAIELYKKVIKDDSNYETAKTRIGEATNNYRQAALDEAATYAENGAYTNAIAVLEAALEVIPGDADLTSQKLLYEKDHLNQIKQDALDEAESYAVSGNYETAMAVLDKYVADYGTDSEVSVKRNEYLESYVAEVLKAVDKSQEKKDYAAALKTLDDALKVAKDNTRLKNRREAVVKAYAEEVCTEADTLVAAKKYDEAIELINKALGVIPGNTTLTAKRTEIEDVMPKCLLDVCKPYESSEYDEYINGRTFAMGGEEYTNGFRFNGYNGSYAIWNLNQNYTSLEFDLGHVDGTGMEEVTVEIYLDGVLFKSIKVNAENLPVHYSIDLTAVKQLKIVSTQWRDNAQMGFANVIVQ